MKIENQVRATLETLEHARPLPTTAAPSRVPSESAKKNWQTKWLKLKLYHHQLTAMADELHKFAGGIHLSPQRGRMLVIYGANGCGKTHGARAIHAWLEKMKMNIGPQMARGGRTGHEIKWPSSIMVNWAETVDGFKRGEFEISEQLKTETLVVIDDVGAEHDVGGNGRAQLYSILNRRENKWTIVTTNVLPKDWPEKFENRIASRLFRNATHIDLTQVPDYSTI